MAFALLFYSVQTCSANIFPNLIIYCTKLLTVSDNIANLSGPVGVRLLLQRFRLNY